MGSTNLVSVEQPPDVFLGGTCNGSQWRESLKPLLTATFFDPVVPEWNAEAQAREVKAREESKYVVYTLTPKMTGVYSVAEVVDDSNKRPEKTVLLVLEEDGDAKFTEHQIKSLNQVKKLVAANGGKVASSLEEVATLLNAESA
jgi:hypothetical protein